MVTAIFVHFYDYCMSRRRAREDVATSSSLLFGGAQDNKDLGKWYSRPLLLNLVNVSVRWLVALPSLPDPSILDAYSRIVV